MADILEIGQNWI